MASQNSDEQPSREVASARTEEAGLEADRFFSAWRQKTGELVSGGLREGHARGVAQLEMRIAQWPSGWGEDLLVLIYGDFEPPPAVLDFPDLGITIEPDRVTNSIVRSALCVLKARVRSRRSRVKALDDAAARINTLLACWPC